LTWRWTTDAAIRLMTTLASPAATRDGPNSEAAQKLFDYLQGRDVAARLIAAKALEGYSVSEVSVVTLKVDWSALLNLMAVAAQHGREPFYIREQRSRGLSAGLPDSSAHEQKLAGERIRDTANHDVVLRYRSIVLVRNRPLPACPRRVHYDVVQLGRPFELKSPALLQFHGPAIGDRSHQQSRSLAKIGEFYSACHPYAHGFGFPRQHGGNVGGDHHIAKADKLVENGDDVRAVQFVWRHLNWPL